MEPAMMRHTEREKICNQVLRLGHVKAHSALNLPYMLSNDPRYAEQVPIVSDSQWPAAFEEVPDGGLVAWLQVAGSFFLFFNSWGVVNTFGVFQTFYQTQLLSNDPPSTVSWIGSIQSFLLLLMGVITGPLYDAGCFRALILSGTFLLCFGFMMTSLCSQYWQVLLAQAICIGLGQGCLSIPSVAMIPQYFNSKRGLATGIAASGSSFGGVIYPIIFRQLEQKIGFPWTTRVLGFIALITCLFSLSVMRIGHPPQQKRVLLEPGAFREASYSLFCVSMFFGYLGFFGPVFYIQAYAIKTNAMSDKLGFYLLPILNAASIPGRIIPGFLATRTDPINLLLPAAIATGGLSLCWISIHTSTGLIVFSVLYGFCSGAFIALPAVALMSLTPDLRRLGTRMGMESVVCGVGSLIGSPISGALLSTRGGYLGVQLFSGIAMMITGLFLYATRYYKLVRVKGGDSGLASEKSGNKIRKKSGTAAG